MYGYVEANPTLKTDPLGLFAVSPEGADICPAAFNPKASAWHCCRNGRRVVCLSDAFEKGWKPKVRECAIRHEKSHIQDAEAWVGCDCRAARCMPQSSGNQPKSECLAWWDSYWCFRDSHERHPGGGSWEDYAFWAAFEAGDKGTGWCFSEGAL